MDKQFMERVVAQLDRIEVRQDRAEAKLDANNETLIRNTVTLEDHVKRTNLLEQELKPIKSHVTFVNWTAKGLIALIGAVSGLKHLGFFEHFHW